MDGSPGIRTPDDICNYFESQGEVWSKLSQANRALVSTPTDIGDFFLGSALGYEGLWNEGCLGGWI